MPRIGEVKRGKEIGYSGNGKFIFSACQSCGKQRWVELTKGLPRSPRCKSCAPKENSTRIIKNCEECGKQISVYLSAIKRGAGKFCSRSCYQKHKFIGQYKSHGYIRVRVSPKDFFYPMAFQKDKYGGYILEHRLVVAKAFNRCLLPWEIVHHKGVKYPTGSDEDKQDNRYPENLELLPLMKRHLPSMKVQAELKKRDKKIEELGKRVTLLEAEDILLREQIKELERQRI